MSKSTGVRAISLLLGLLLCLPMQVAFAQPVEGDGNFTVHTINPSDYYTSMKPGNNQTVTVSFTNEGNEKLNVTPKVVPGYSDNNFNENWITVSPTSITVDPGTEQEFAIEINIPEDADSGSSEAQIVFTDDVAPDTGYINVMHLYVNIFASPKLELQTGYISDTLEAGEEYKYTIKMKNVADKDITIDPKITHYYDGQSQAFNDDIIEISALSTIKAGEITNMTIQIPVPENATGTYSGVIKMNIDGQQNNGYDPQLGMDFSIWEQPVVPYVKTFSTTTTDPITIEISTDTYENNPGLRSPEKKEPSFKLNLKYKSSPVTMTFVKTTHSGSVSVGGHYYNYPEWAMDDSTIYQNYGGHYAETYKVPGAIGDWELTILPKDTQTFGYSITFGDSK